MALVVPVGHERPADSGAQGMPVGQTKPAGGVGNAPEETGDIPLAAPTDERPLKLPDTAVAAVPPSAIVLPLVLIAVGGRKVFTKLLLLPAAEV